MSSNSSEFVVNPGKDFTRKRKLSFIDVITFLIVIGNTNTNLELVKYFDFTCLKHDK